jgi:hypothetical protein
MKSGLRLLNFILLGWFVALGCEVRGQTLEPVQQAGIVTNIVTMGGFTIANYKWGMGGTEVLEGTGPLFRNGTNFFYNFDFEEYTGIQPDFAYLEYTNVLLGALVPGTYNLITTSWGVPLSTNAFTILPIAPQLLPIGFDSNGFFEIQMLGVATNINYVLQYSTNLTDWTSVSTNLISNNAISIVLTDNSPAAACSRFYRVVCQ